MIYREYSKKERLTDQRVFYGWTKSKQMVLAFLKQRSPKKYRVKEVDLDTVRSIYGESLSLDTELDFAALKSAKTRETIYLIMTKLEMQETEKRVARYFRELSSLEQAGSDIMEVLRLFVNLNDYYGSALFFLGFRPTETDILFNSADPRDDYSSTEMLEEGIDEEYDHPFDFKIFNPVTPWITEDVSKQLIYSFEAFIRVLKDEM